MTKNLSRVAVVLAAALVCVLGLHFLAGVAATMGVCALLNAWK